MAELAPLDTMSPGVADMIDWYRQGIILNFEAANPAVFDCSIEPEVNGPAGQVITEATVTHYSVDESISSLTQRQVKVVDPTSAVYRRGATGILAKFVLTEKEENYSRNWGNVKTIRRMRWLVARTDPSGLTRPLQARGIDLSRTESVREDRSGYHGNLHIEPYREMVTTIGQLEKFFKEAVQLVSV